MKLKGMNSNPLGVRKGIWTPDEDILLRKCIERYGEGKWHLVPLRAGLNRCRKSCRLRWLNYLKPNIKRGAFTKDEVDLIIRLHKLLGNRWSLIAGRLPGRTANDVKNFWNSHIEKKAAAETLTGRVGSPKTITRSNIFRPQPRTFFELYRSSQLGTGQASLVTRNPGTEKKDNFQPPISHCHEADECREWWSNLLKMATDNQRSDPQTNVCGKQGEGDDAGLTDFSIDIDIWKLLSFGDGE